MNTGGLWRTRPGVAGRSRSALCVTLLLISPMCCECAVVTPRSTRAAAVNAQLHSPPRRARCQCARPLLFHAYSLTRPTRPPTDMPLRNPVPLLAPAPKCCAPPRFRPPARRCARTSGSSDRRHMSSPQRAVPHEIVVDLIRTSPPATVFLAHGPRLPARSRTPLAGVCALSALALDITLFALGLRGPIYTMVITPGS